MGMTALWMGVVIEKPRIRMPSMSEGLRPSVSNDTGLASYSRLDPRDVRARRGMRPHVAVRVCRSGDRDAGAGDVKAAAVLCGNSN